MPVQKHALAWAGSLSLMALMIGVTACGNTTSRGGNGGAATAAEPVKIDGSSTVFPISERMASEFKLVNPDATISLKVSGSGGGFEKFCAGETDISNASRPIKQKEIDVCTEAGIDFIELPVAFDGITVVRNSDNSWAQCLSIEQLNAIWAPEAEGRVLSWNQVDPSFPDEPLKLYGPGHESGTFDYFTEAVNGEEGAERGDYLASEDDTVIVKGVQAESGALAYFGYAYYEANANTLKSVAIENADGTCITPSRSVIAGGDYNPLSRPLFIYVKVDSYQNNPSVAAFADFMVSAENKDLIADTGYIPMPTDIQDRAVARLAEATTGSIYEGGSSVGVKLSEKL